MLLPTKAILSPSLKIGMFCGCALTQKKMMQNARMIAFFMNNVIKTLIILKLSYLMNSITCVPADMVIVLSEISLILPSLTTLA